MQLVVTADPSAYCFLGELPSMPMAVIEGIKDVQFETSDGRKHILDIVSKTSMANTESSARMVLETCSGKEVRIFSSSAKLVEMDKDHH